MTQTEMKLRDAATQMRIAMANAADESVVRSCVNSFIAAARSVTFVMQSESAKSPELKAWYEEQMGGMKALPLLRFFNEQRVYSIHKGVVAPTTEHFPLQSITVGGVTTTGEGTIALLRFTGTEEFLPGESGGVFRLCEQYFIILHGLVIAWLNKRTELGIDEE